jgi:predicted Fe-S protein YdhL (DUF1289 family)
MFDAFCALCVRTRTQSSNWEKMITALRGTPVCREHLLELWEIEGLPQLRVWA